MKNLNLGKQLTKEEQKQIKGGEWWTYTCSDGRTSAFYYENPAAAGYGALQRCGEDMGVRIRRVELI